MPTAYVTVPRTAAEDLVEVVLTERLAACVNRIPCESTYRWEGSVETDEEAILLCKTTEDAYDKLVDRIRAVHPHDVPCIERFDEADVDDPYREWIAESVDATGTGNSNP